MDEHGFESRLRHLEHVLVGQQTAQVSKLNKESILKRIETLHKELNSVYKNNKSIKDFIEKCRRFLTCSKEFGTDYFFI